MQLPILIRSSSENSSELLKKYQHAFPLVREVPGDEAGLDKPYDKLQLKSAAVHSVT